MPLPDHDQLRPLRQADLTRHDAGRTRRLPGLALRELLGALDGERCRFPGCTRHRTLHAHHVKYWTDGGPTDLANLVLLCARHHTLVHTGSYALRLRPNRTLTVHTTAGDPVQHHPVLPWHDPDQLDPHRRIEPETLPPPPTATASTSATPSPCSCNTPPEAHRH